MATLGEHEVETDPGSAWAALVVLLSLLPETEGDVELRACAAVILAEGEVQRARPPKVGP